MRKESQLLMPGIQHNSPRTPKDYSVEILSADGIWEQCGQVSHQAPSKTDLQKRGGGRIFISVVSVAATIFLHGLLLGGLLLGSAGRPPVKRAPFVEGTSVATDGQTEAATVLFFINSHSITPPDWSPDEMSLPASKNIERQADDALLASIDAMEMPELGGSESGSDQESPTVEAMGDGAGQALLFGRYMGQIKARIERAWRLPIVSSAEQFECRVQIKQDRHGNVQEVILQRCGDDPAWQLSLVQAIQHASPLSGPPDESVFTSIVLLNFTAEQQTSLAHISRTVTESISIPSTSEESLP